VERNFECTALQKSPCVEQGYFVKEQAEDFFRDSPIRKEIKKHG